MALGIITHKISLCLHHKCFYKRILKKSMCFTPSFFISVYQTVL